MSTFYHDINRKVASAVEGVINALKGSGLVGVTIFKGATFAEIVTNRIEILTSAEVEQFGATITGNYTVAVRVRVIGHSEDASAASHSLNVSTVGDILFRDDFIAQIDALNPAVADFSADSWYPRAANDSIEGSEFVTEFTAEIHCWPS